jgi:hypothetical protein
MDFGKMEDQLSEKVKEDLVQEVDEIKVDIEKKFGGRTEPNTTIPGTSENVQAPSSESGSLQEPDPDAANEEETQDDPAVAETEAGQEIGDDERNEKVA